MNVFFTFVRHSSFINHIITTVFDRYSINNPIAPIYIRHWDIKDKEDWFFLSHIIIVFNIMRGRFKYFLKSWAFSTNHKRIAVNYFWFVLLSGIIGMLLATLIRLELAYPGIGVLAGDATQYLSIVTAHGIIMVFFMAIPLLFGFLGNFLLPTQLGVHDVAFPRMNSAAFWFLPASLIALAHTLCTDRRYNKLNEFNVVELQDLLRRKYMDEFAPRFKFTLNNEESKLGLFSSNFYNFSDTLSDLSSLQKLMSVTSSKINNSYQNSFFFYDKPFVFYNSKILHFLFNTESSLLNNLYSRFSSEDHTFAPYKVKTGDYLPYDLFSQNFFDLVSSFSSVSGSGFRSFYIMSSSFMENVQKFTDLLFSKEVSEKEFSSHIGFLFTTYFAAPLSSVNLHFWFERNINLGNFFLRIIFSQIKQNRFLSDARNLQVSREGWRCRLLASRHQRALFRRYVNESETVWIIERNAKDLLPGWALITPFSARTRYTLLGKTDIGIVVVALTLISSMISSANFLMTYKYLSTLNNKKRRDARSFFAESLIVASWMMLAANPMLIFGLLMLLADRHWRTSFFDYSGGGDTILFQHMFWFFGHPEVYIIIMPCFGITNTLLSFYLRKRISARSSLLYSLYTIAFLGFFVWGHHMYMVGLSHTTRMLYSTLTVMISVPAATKIMHWLVTISNSSVHFELPFFLTLLFIFYFVSGGISGMNVAHTGMSVLFHDTFYVIGHFHVMFAGALMFSTFAAFYFYLPSVLGVRYSRFFSYMHVFYYTIGQTFTVAPMIWLGYIGMPRRVLDYPAAMGGWHSIISSAHIITVSGVFSFVLMLLESLRKQHGYAIKTFGVGRYNTRLNFFLYEKARNRYWLGKYGPLFGVRRRTYSKTWTKSAFNLEYIEGTTLYYTIIDRNIDLQKLIIACDRVWVVGHYPRTLNWGRSSILFYI